MISHRHAYRAISDTLSIQSIDWTESGSREVVIDLTFPIASGANQSYSLALVAATIRSIIITSDAAATIKTNSTTVPDDTIALDGSTPIVWGTTKALGSKPINHDVTTLYITPTSADVRIRMRLLLP